MEKGAIRFHGLTAELLERPDLLRSIFLEGAAASAGAAKPARSSQGAVRRGHRRRAGSPRSRRTAASAESCSRPRTSPSGSPASPRSTTCRSSSTRARSSASSARTAPARPRCSTSSRGSSSPTRARSSSTASTSPSGARNGARNSGSRVRSRTPACSARSRCTRRCASRSTGRAQRLRPGPASAPPPERRTAPSASVGKRADELIEMMGLGDFRDKFVSDLSTGSRRIVDLACQIGIDPKVILFDEPSSGIAQRETEALGPLLLRIREHHRREHPAHRARHAAHHSRLRPHRRLRPRARSWSTATAETVLEPPARRRVVPRFVRGRRSTAPGSEHAKVLERARQGEQADEHHVPGTSADAQDPTRRSAGPTAFVGKYKNSFSVARSSLFWALLRRQKRTLKWMFFVSSSNSIALAPDRELHARHGRQRDRRPDHAALGLGRARSSIWAVCSLLRRLRRSMMLLTAHRRTSSSSTCGCGCTRTSSRPTSAGSTASRAVSSSPARSPTSRSSSSCCSSSRPSSATCRSAHRARDPRHHPEPARWASSRCSRCR